MVKTLEDSAVLHTADLDTLYEEIFSDFLFTTGGESAQSRMALGTSSAADSSGGLRLTGFRCKRTEPVTKITYMTGASGAGATPSLIRYGLWLLTDAGDSYNLVASTPHDATLLVATNTSYPKNVSVPYTKLRGKEYLVGVLVVTAAAVPVFLMPPPASTSNYHQVFTTQPPFRGGRLGAQADLPANITAASILNVASAGPGLHCIVG